MSSRVIRVATRASDLALRQARIVADALEKTGHTCEIVTIRTKGDRRKADPLSAIGAKGLFTRELELALSKGKVDCCVHSLKDLPTELPGGLGLAAILEREDPRDVLVVNPITEAEDIATLPAGSRVGTSSLRRRAQLHAARRDLEVVDLRGNVPTRLAKVEAGRVHAAILAAAGLIRLGAADRIRQYLEPPDWLPCAGQGAIAVEVRSDDLEMLELCGRLDHPATAIATTAERAFLRGLEGGCQVPIGALAAPDESGVLVLHGFVSDIAGNEFVRGSVLVDGDDPFASGQSLASELLTRGATSLLLELRSQDKVTAPQPE